MWILGKWNCLKERLIGPIWMGTSQNHSSVNIAPPVIVVWPATDVAIAELVIKNESVQQVEIEVWTKYNPMETIQHIIVDNTLKRIGEAQKIKRCWSKGETVSLQTNCWVRLARNMAGPSRRDHEDVQGLKIRVESKVLWISSDREMTDKEQIEALYREMYRVMVEKDTATLNRVHAVGFVLTHMTGMHQSKRVYIQSIANGTLRR